jgi:DNA repair protein SbcC/Rad50
MLFARFLKQRPAANPADSAAPAPTQDALAAQAGQATADPALRCAAIAQVLNLAQLRQLATDPLPDIRAAAAARYQELLCSSGNPALPFTAQRAALTASTDQQLLDFVALNAEEPTLRAAALARVTDPAVLAACAVSDPVAAHRSAAVARLETREALEQVVRLIGKKDKHVYRVARDKLRLLTEQEARPAQLRAQCEALCTAATRLGRLGNSHQDRALLEHLERQWAEVAAAAPADVQVRFAAERERFLHATAAQSRAAAEQVAAQAVCAVAAAERQFVLDALAAAAQLSDEAELNAEVARIHAAWLELPPAPRELEARYQALRQTALATQQQFSAQRDHAERLQRTVTLATRLLDDSKPLEHRRVRSVVTQGRSLVTAQPEAALAAEFNAVAERLEARLQQQRKHAEQRLQQLPERLAELEARLAAGEVKKADPLYQSVQAGLALVQASELPKTATADIANRLRQLAPQLRELQQWRRWGADQHREGLCAEMTALVTAEVAETVLAEELHRLQIDWKQLDQSGSPAQQALWERFHAASELVYARCRAFLAAQAAEREANRRAREQVCQQLEAFLSLVDWERVEWKKILRAEREMRQMWAAIGATEGRHRKALERRFYQSLRQLDRRLDAERKANHAHKQHLLAQVQELVTLPNLEAALEQVKLLQREWHTTVPGHQRVENRLWQHFRSTCDAVFERRAALQHTQVHEVREQAAVREALCAEALALAAASDISPAQLTAQLRDLDERWRLAQQFPLVRQLATALARQWRESREALALRLQMAEAQQRLAALEVVRQQAACCEQLEHSVLGVAAVPIAPAIAQQQWLALTADMAADAALAARFEQALAAAEQPELVAALQQQFAVNGALRQRLCLQLEIIAGMESPPEWAQQRLEFQVARLAERMVGGEEDPLQDATQLLHEWYRSGPAPADAALAARFERVGLALAR